MGNGKSLSISHTRQTTIVAPQQAVHLPNILCVPHLQKKKKILIAKLCKSKQVSVEFFASNCFCEGSLQASRLRGENKNEICCVALPCCPQINVTDKMSLSDWHRKLGHLFNKILNTILKHNGLISTPLLISTFSCTSYSINKNHKLPFST